MEGEGEREGCAVWRGKVRGRGVQCGGGRGWVCSVEVGGVGCAVWRWEGLGVQCGGGRGWVCSVEVEGLGVQCGGGGRGWVCSVEGEGGVCNVEGEGLGMEL